MRRETIFSLLRELWTRDGATRRELEASLNLSRPTVDKALAELMGRGLIGPVGTCSHGGGRPATVFRVNGSVCSVVGVDLELPQLTCVLTNLWGEPLHRMTVDVNDGYHKPLALVHEVGETLTQWMDLLDIPWARVGGMGVALPAFVADGVATFAGSTMPSWRGVAVQDLLEREIPARVHVHRDTYLMALAEARALEWTDGALFYVALRPGLHGDVRFGASLLVDGRPYQGGHGHGGSLYKAVVSGEQLASRNREERLELLVERAVEFLVHAVTLLDPDRIAIHAGLLGADEEAFIVGCRRRLRAALAGEFSQQYTLTPAVERGPTAALGAAISVVHYLSNSPEFLWEEGGGNGRTKVLPAFDNRNNNQNKEKYRR